MVVYLVNQRQDKQSNSNKLITYDNDNDSCNHQQKRRSMSISTSPFPVVAEKSTKFCGVASGVRRAIILMVSTN